MIDVDEILARAEVERQRRTARLPTEQSAIHAIHQAKERLKESFGWRDGIYCPKDGTVFETLSHDSTGIHLCSYSGVWNTGFFDYQDGGDIYPSRTPPMLWRQKP